MIITKQIKKAIGERRFNDVIMVNAKAQKNEGAIFFIDTIQATPRKECNEVVWIKNTFPYKCLLAEFHDGRRDQTYFSRDGCLFVYSCSYLFIFAPEIQPWRRDITWI